LNSNSIIISIVSGLGQIIAIGIRPKLPTIPVVVSDAQCAAFFVLGPFDDARDDAEMEELRTFWVRCVLDPVVLLQKKKRVHFSVDFAVGGVGFLINFDLVRFDECFKFDQICFKYLYQFDLI